MRRPPPSAALPFSRPIDVERLPEGGEDVAIAATAEECAAIAAENGLLALGRLDGAFRIVRRGRDGARVTGTVTAVSTQRCVVSLEPFDTAVSEPVDVSFAPPGAAGEPAAGMALGDADPPDPLIDNTIDLGGLATEFLVLGLDPYPHKPGIAFEDRVDPATGSPFDVLRKLAERP
jgi:hypothetical protein